MCERYRQNTKLFATKNDSKTPWLYKKYGMRLGPINMHYTTTAHFNTKITVQCDLIYKMCAIFWYLFVSFFISLVSFWFRNAD